MELLLKNIFAPKPFFVENPVQLSSVSIFQDVHIGKYSYMNDGMVREQVDIGRYCSIGRNVLIAAGDHPLDCLTTHPIAFQAATRPARPTNSNRKSKHDRTLIGHDVWIGDNAVVIKGVHVGIGAVIGANAVVTQDVAPYSIVGGVPARHIRYRFSEPVIAALLASEWWMISNASLKTLDMNNIQECLAKTSSMKDLGHVDPINYVNGLEIM